MIPTLADALAERGYDTLTPVQEAVSDPALDQADLLVSAQTGSGKTVGFGLAIAPTLMGDQPRLGPPAQPLALIVAPTRELALQVQRELQWLYAKAGARIVSCIGGMDAREERRALDRGAHIVVGTPGRLRDHITRRSLVLSDIRAVVLDEADEMLDLGFREDLEFMLGEAPEDRRTLMFSATVPSAIEQMAKKFQRDAKRIQTQSAKGQHSDISYQAVQVATHDAENAIINMLRFYDAPTAIVFANTRAAVARLTARMSNRGFLVVSLSGELSQDERTRALQSLRDGRARVCIATDVAARGIDLPNLELVIHADLPTNTEALLHRSGRTGRAGRKGISALIVPDKIARKASRLLQWAKVQAEWVYPPTPEAILALDETRLLNDPAWAAETTEAEAEFAARLVESHDPKTIAIACLRMYRAGLSAPEVLNAPSARNERTPREERAEFGPSVWFGLSVGRDRGAEPRWILPLLCRTGKLDKTKIGRIRVLDTTTYVEISEAAAGEMMTELGPEGLLEDEIYATRQDGVPEEVNRPRPRGDRPDRPDRGDRKPPHRKSPRPDRGPRDEPRQRSERDEAPRPSAPPAGGGAGSSADVGAATPEDAPRKPRHKARSDDGAPKPARAVWGRGPAAPGEREDRKPRDGDKPKWSGDRKPRDADRPSGDKPFKRNDRDDKPRGKPAGKFGGKPEGKPAGKFGGKPGGKPDGKPAYKGKPARNAADPSARMGGPRKAGAGAKGAAKPGGKGGKPAPRKGGNAPPRRKG
ncbi:DEAD/DEAH box helicase [Pseudooceanicola sp.]|uniref:DEAD/DEAH box helicase n=1 Tax=Pseudooceanicola sp. TaxID=1914328 RepID=UPI004058C6B1